MEKQLTDLKDLARRDSSGAGAGFLSVTADGNVYLSNMLQETEFTAGNVRKQGPWEIRRTSPIIEDFRRLHIQDISKCRDCELRYICGGCPAKSFHAYRKLTQCTPWCPFYMEICWSMIRELACDL